MDDATQKSESIKSEEKKVISKSTDKISGKKGAKATPSKKDAEAKSAKSSVGLTKPVKKVQKQKTIRDSFSMPENDYNILATLKKECLKNSIAVKKSQLLRAGLHALSAMNPTALKKQLSILSEIKIGRPKKLSK
jgi:hypothetical protein